jgi:hypothetical protein
VQEDPGHAGGGADDDDDDDDDDDGGAPPSTPLSTLRGRCRRWASLSEAEIAHGGAFDGSFAPSLYPSGGGGGSSSSLAEDVVIDDYGCD